ncbi:hypothetical protein SDC9_180822 [bioreactor metagenome]|uniref:Uncharacterized protein n=1 Tax=bioreactor metagenome TaxID=1076179 RepID=A0A645H4C0_9ZZZZ
MGAFPRKDIAWSILEEVYRPELPQDSTEVRITAFRTEAADANPTFLNTRTNGDAATFSGLPFSRSGSVNGIRVPITKIAPM